MSCSAHQALLPKGHRVQVNGVVIPRDLISREVQHHPSRTPAEAWKAAARALVVRELLLQEAHRLERFRRIRWPMGKAVVKPTMKLPFARSLRRKFERLEPTPRPADAITRKTGGVFALQTSTRLPISCLPPARPMHRVMHRRGPLPKQRSLSCVNIRSSSLNWRWRTRPVRRLLSGGNLGQITAGQTTPEFEQALFALEPGSISPEPIATRYGFHIIRLDRKHEGRELPFELVADRIAEYLRKSVERRALAQYIARLAAAARIEGIDLAGADAMRVN